MANEPRARSLAEIKRGVEDDLLNRPGVVGVDVGYKVVGGVQTSTLAIRVLVERKYDAPEDQLIPSSVRGAPTDVIQRGKISFMADSQRYNPVLGGVSIGTCSGPPGTGTLGAVVMDAQSGRAMALSCWHVLVYGVTGDIQVTQPSPLDGGSCPSDIIGQLAQNAVNDYVDCAVAAISNRAAESEIADWVGEVQGYTQFSIGEQIWKRGRTTGVTYGIVDTLDATVKITDYAGVERTFKNQIGIWRDQSRSNVYLLPGDFGSTSLDFTVNIGGLNFAASTGNPFLPDGAYGYANPIVPVLSALDVYIPPPPKGKDTKDTKEHDKPFKEKDEDLRDGPHSDRLAFRGTMETGPGPLAERLARLEASVDRLQHFIVERDRPNLGSDSDDT